MFRRTLQNFNVTSKIFRKNFLWESTLSRAYSSQRAHDKTNPKTVPRLVYLHNPWAYIQTKFQFLKLRLLWDRDFTHDEFIRGTKQSVIVMTKIIRDQDGMEIGNYTTPVGFQQITRDMILSRNDVRLKLVNFRIEDIHRAIPMKVSLFKRGGRKNCIVDMVFVGMRNIRDFPNQQENQKIQQTLRQLDKEMKISSRVLEVPHRILFAEIYMRFYRDYAPKVLANWSISFYKIISFDVLNYDPQ